MMPIFHGAATPATFGSVPSATEGLSGPEDTNSLAAYSSPSGSGTNQWSPVPTSVDPNRPFYSTVDPYPTATLDLVVSSVPVASSDERSINTRALVGITVSVGIVVMTVVYAIIWWTRRRSKGRHGQQQQRSRAIEEEEEKPPTYEAAVFGIDRNNQANPSLYHIPQQSFPALLPIIQTPPQAHTPRPLSVATRGGTLHRLDTSVSQNQNIAQQHSDIVVYPHDSPPQTPTQPAQQNRLSIRSSQINFNSDSDEIRSSHHITDFSEDYPDTVSFNDDDFSDDEPTIAKEIF